MGATRALATTAAVAMLGACAASPQSLPADQVRAAFVALVRAPDRTMHMEWTGSTALAGRGSSVMPFSASFDFAGDDYAGTLTTPPDIGFGTEGGRPYVAELASVDGHGYRREPGSSAWQRSTIEPTNLDPLRRLELADMEYVGVERIDGRDLHHLRLTDMAALIDRMFEADDGVMPGGAVRYDGASSSLDIFVDSTARPVSAAMDLATSAHTLDFGVISMSSRYTFTNWGAAIEIVAPQ